jgi:hypothetical protein
MNFFSCYVDPLFQYSANRKLSSDPYNRYLDIGVLTLIAEDAFLGNFGTPIAKAKKRVMSYDNRTVE